jgi:hypothetical protein
LATASISHLAPAAANFTCTRASLPLPSAATITPSPKRA